jgi:hypothetical protein
MLMLNKMNTLNNQSYYSNMKKLKVMIVDGNLLDKCQKMKRDKTSFVGNFI